MSNYGVHIQINSLGELSVKVNGRDIGTLNKDPEEVLLSGHNFYEDGVFDRAGCKDKEESNEARKP